MAKLAGHACDDGAFLRWVSAMYSQRKLTFADIQRLYRYVNSLELWFNTIPLTQLNSRDRQAGIFACYRPPPPPAPIPLPGTPARFTYDFWCPAVSVANQNGWRPELVLATWGVDTGWGVAHGMMSCHALLGISCNGPGPGYSCTLCNPSQCFRCFNSFGDFYRDFVSVTNASHYNVVRAVATPEAQATALSTQTSFAGGSSSYLGALETAFRVIMPVLKPRC